MAKSKRRPPTRVVMRGRGHSGRLRPHRHTSYALITFLLLLLSVILLGLSIKAEAEYLAVTATVSGNLPPESAVITAPDQEERFTVIPIDVSGTCPAAYLVRLFRNDTFTGSELCDSNGRFSITSDLFVGINELKARVYNGANEEGPTSKAVTVYYDPPAGTALGEPEAPSQLVLRSKGTYKGFLINEPVTWPIDVTGGTPPYAVSVGWGDSKTELLSRSAAGAFDITHTYKKPGENRGAYVLGVAASDATGQKAALQVTLFISDPASLLNDRAKTEKFQFLQALRQQLLISWPFVGAAGLMTVSFWLGERREVFLMKFKRPKLKLPRRRG